MRHLRDRHHVGFLCDLDVGFGVLVLIVHVSHSMAIRGQTSCMLWLRKESLDEKSSCGIRFCRDIGLRFPRSRAKSEAGRKSAGFPIAEWEARSQRGVGPS